MPAPDVPTLLAHLRDHRPPELSGVTISARPVQANAFEANVFGANTFQVRAGDRAFFVKWVAAEDARGRHELSVGRRFARLKVVPAPRLRFTLEAAGGTIAGWDWVDGADLRERNRERLPEAFARLGRLHRALRNRGPLQAPLGDQHYPDARALIAAEAYRLTALVDSPARERLPAVLARLEVGYPTLIHGDAHPGNFLLEGERLWIVDWAYACNSLNLFDLDYIRASTYAGPGPDWSNIHPSEAGAVLAAYFQAAGLEGVDIERTHRAVMAWDLLRSHEQAVRNGYRAEAQRERAALEALLEEDRAASPRHGPGEAPLG